MAIDLYYLAYDPPTTKAPLTQCKSPAALEAVRRKARDS